MIVVKVELWSAATGDVREIARMTVDNIGGTEQLGDYRARTMRGRSAESLHRAMIRNQVTREGRVYRHPRLREHVWNLVAKALAGMAYGTGAAYQPPVGEDFEEVPHFDMVKETGGVRMVALDTWERDNEATLLRLQLEATNDITPEQVAAWSDDQVKEADCWACSVHLSASDNDDVIVPPRPSFIPHADRMAGRHPITGEPI